MPTLPMMSGTISTNDVGCSKKEKRARYYQENKETFAPRERARYWINRESRLARAKAYYWENRAKILPKAVQYERQKRSSCVVNPINRICVEPVLIGFYYSIPIKRIVPVLTQEEKRILRNATSRAWAQANRDKRKLYWDTWKKAHPEKYHVNQVRRNIRKRKWKQAMDPKECLAANRLIAEWKSEPDFECRYCRETFPISKLQVDHYVPVSKGGKHSVDNIKKSCPECNSQKRSKIGPKCWFMQNCQWWKYSNQMEVSAGS